MAFNGVIINKTDGNLGRLPANRDRVIGLIAGGVATSDLLLDTPVRIVAPEQAEELGINASYDANNDVVVYDHIVECFRLNPNAEIILMLTAQPTGDLSDWFDDDDVVETFLRNPVAKDVKYLFTAFNPDFDTFTTAFTDNGACTQVLACFAPAQLIVNKFFSEYRYIDGIMLDGIEIDTIAGLQDLRALDAPNVSMLIAIDSYHKANHNSEMAIGAAMGMLSVRQINENIGSVEILNPPPAFQGRENYPLDNGVRFATAYLGKDTIEVASLSLTVINDVAAKGYIFAGSFNGYPGFYFSGDPTAVPTTSDYAFINNNCVWNKAARLTREALIPKVRSIIKKDPVTGFIRPTTAEALASLGQKKLDTMVAGDLCSAAKISIDPNQTPNDQTPLVAEVQVVKDGILHTFSVDLGLFNSITN